MIKGWKSKVIISVALLAIPIVYAIDFLRTGCINNLISGTASTCGSEAYPQIFGSLIFVLICTVLIWIYPKR